MCCNQVDTSGTIWTFAGDGGEGRRGDGGPATAASLSLPLGMALSTSGVMYVADFGNNVIRMVRMLVLSGVRVCQGVMIGMKRCLRRERWMWQGKGKACEMGYCYKYVWMG